MPSTLLSRKVAAPLALALVLGLSGCGVFGGKGKPSTPTVGNRVPILSRVESGAKVDPALAEIAVVLPPAAANADWPQAGGNAGKSYGNLALAGAPGRAWTGSVAGSGKKQRLGASPVVGGGMLFAMGTDGMVTAFDAASGARRWSQSFSVKGDEANTVYGGGASFADGKVYITTGVGEVAALDATTGKVAWKVKPAGPLRGSPTVAFDALYVMTQDNQMLAPNTSDGSLQWNKSV